jgi:hypothetical protein
MLLTNAVIPFKKIKQGQDQALYSVPNEALQCLYSSFITLAGRQKCEI